MIQTSIHTTPCSYNDLVTITSWINSPEELLIWAGNKFSYPILIKEFSDNLLNNGTIGFAIWSKEVIVGYAEIAGINKEKGTAFFCRIMVEASQRQKGIGREIVRFLLRYSKDQLQLKTVYLNVFITNSNAIAIYEKEGFNFIENSDYISECKGIKMTGKRMYCALI